jgi:hypothetical protein
MKRSMRYGIKTKVLSSFTEYIQTSKGKNVRILIKYLNLLFFISLNFLDNWSF